MIGLQWKSSAERFVGLKSRLRVLPTPLKKSLVLTAALVTFGATIAKFNRRTWLLCAFLTCMHNLNPRRLTIVRSRESRLSVLDVAGGIAVRLVVCRVLVANVPVVLSTQLNFLAPTEPIGSPTFLVEKRDLFFER